MSDQPFKATQEWPYHLSVGAVVLNERNEILVHYFDVFGYDEAKVTDFHILIRETVEPGESIGAALDRGLSEETGARAELVHYIGQLESRVKAPGFEWTKTTAYFVMRLTNWAPERRLTDDPEAGSELRWIAPAKLLDLMRRQHERIGNTDLDEAPIIERAIKVIESGHV